MIMAKNCYTSIEFWLRLPLRQLMLWIEESNEIIREEKAR